MYQSMYALCKQTTFPTFYLSDFNLYNFLTRNAFYDRPQPWVFANAANIAKKGLNYGIFTCVFTKNSLFPTLQLQTMRNQYYVGGTPFLPDSFSVFCMVGYNFNAIPYCFFDNVLLNIRDGCNQLLVTRNGFDITNYDGYSFSMNDSGDRVFEFTRNDDNYFTSLTVCTIKFHPYQVNLTMSVMNQNLQLSSPA